MRLTEVATIKAKQQATATKHFSAAFSATVCFRCLLFPPRFALHAMRVCVCVQREKGRAYIRNPHSDWWYWYNCGHSNANIRMANRLNEISKLLENKWWISTQNELLATSKPKENRSKSCLNTWEKKEFGEYLCYLKKITIWPRKQMSVSSKKNTNLKLHNDDNNIEKKNATCTHIAAIMIQFQLRLLICTTFFNTHMCEYAAYT